MASYTERRFTESVGVSCSVSLSKCGVAHFWGKVYLFIYLSDGNTIHNYINIAPSEGTPIQAVAQRDRALEN